MSGAEGWWGPRGQAPVSSEDPAVEKPKKKSKPINSLYQQIWKISEFLLTNFEEIE